MLIRVANELKAANPTAISEDNMSARGRKLPPRGFLLHASVVSLEPWAFRDDSGLMHLSWFLLLAIIVEARNSKPCSLS